MALPHTERWSLVHALLDQLVEKQLRNDQSALVDCVARVGAERRFAATAARHAAPFFVGRVHLRRRGSAPPAHRRARDAGFLVGTSCDWKDVEVTARNYEPLDCTKLVVDAGDQFDANLARVRAHLGIGKDASCADGEDRMSQQGVEGLRAERGGDARDPEAA